MRGLALVLLVIWVTSVADGRRYGRCELARQLVNCGIPRSKVADWVCLAEAESRLNTGVRSGPDRDGSYNFGIFQINGYHWCGPEGYNNCGIRCSSLLDNNIKDDLRCAKLIYSRRGGFNAWVGWRYNCKGRKVSYYVKDCSF